MRVKQSARKSTGSQVLRPKESKLKVKRGSPKEKKAPIFYEPRVTRSKAKINPDLLKKEVAKPADKKPKQGE